MDACSGFHPFVSHVIQTLLEFFRVSFKSFIETDLIDIEAPLVNLKTTLLGYSEVIVIGTHDYLFPCSEEYLVMLCKVVIQK